MAIRKRRTSRRPRSFSKSLINGRIISSVLKFIFRLLPFVLAVVLAGVGLRAAVFFLLNSDCFRIKTIKVAGEKLDSSLKPVEIELGSKKGKNIFSFNLQETESDIRYKHPEIKEVRVRRILPDTLEVSYEIRRPFCQIDSGRFYLVSDDMVVFPSPSVAAEPGLSIITGIDISGLSLGPDRRSSSKALKRAIGLLKEIEESNFSKRYKVVRVNIYDPRNPSIYMEDETRIEIGEYGFKEKEALLLKVLDDLESKNKKAKIIDLRFEDVVVIPR